MKSKSGFVAISIVIFAVVFTVGTIAAQRGEPGQRGGERANHHLGHRWIPRRKCSTPPSTKFAW